MTREQLKARLLMAGAELWQEENGNTGEVEEYDFWSDCGSYVLFYVKFNSRNGQKLIVRESVAHPFVEIPIGDGIDNCAGIWEAVQQKLEVKS